MLSIFLLTCLWTLNSTHTCTIGFLDGDLEDYRSRIAAATTGERRARDTPRRTDQYAVTDFLDSDLEDCVCIGLLLR